VGAVGQPTCGVDSVSAVTDLVRPLWRALVVFRVLAWGFAVLGVYTRWDELHRRWGAVVLLAAMAVWTVVVSFGYSRTWGRSNTRLAVADLVVTVACMAGTLLAQRLDAIHDGASILTSVWAAGPVLALAIARGRDGGLLGAVAISLTTGALIAFGDWSRLLNNIQLLLVAGLVVGYAATATRRANARLTDAIATEAATAERLRLSRTIHDGVLQVLAQVQHRGGDLAPVAAEQEIALRSLMNGRATSLAGESDLRAGLSVLASPRVEVVVPASPVPLRAHRVSELVAAVREALANFTRHAGPDARAWVVVEDLGGEVLVVVRDDGVGTSAERIEHASRDGRLGVSQSIRGRIADLGGTAEVRTAPGEGVEWELKVSR
jgi:signal transduction histidine kinase